MLAASKVRQRHNESATKLHKDICNRCGGKGHHSTVCPSAERAAPAYGMSVEPLSDSESEDASEEESPAAHMLIDDDSEDNMDDDIFMHCAFSANDTLCESCAPSSDTGADYSSDDLNNICAACNATPIWTEHGESEELYRDELTLQSDSNGESSSEL